MDEAEEAIEKARTATGNHVEVDEILPHKVYVADNAHGRPLHPEAESRPR
jgi:hypothetical protein